MVARWQKLAAAAGSFLVQCTLAKANCLSQNGVPIPLPPVADKSLGFPTWQCFDRTQSEVLPITARDSDTPQSSNTATLDSGTATPDESDTTLKSEKIVPANTAESTSNATAPVVDSSDTPVGVTESRIDSHDMNVATDSVQGQEVVSGDVPSNATPCPFRPESIEPATPEPTASPTFQHQSIADEPLGRVTIDASGHCSDPACPCHMPTEDGTTTEGGSVDDALFTEPVASEMPAPVVETPEPPIVNSDVAADRVTSDESNEVENTASPSNARLTPMIDSLLSFIDEMVDVMGEMTAGRSKESTSDGSSSETMPDQSKISNDETQDASVYYSELDAEEMEALSGSVVAEDMNRENDGIDDEVITSSEAPQPLATLSGTIEPELSPTGEALAEEMSSRESPATTSGGESPASTPETTSPSGSIQEVTAPEPTPMPVEMPEPTPAPETLEVPTVETSQPSAMPQASTDESAAPTIEQPAATLTDSPVSSESSKSDETPAVQSPVTEPLTPSIESTEISPMSASGATPELPTPVSPVDSVEKSNPQVGWVSDPTPETAMTGQDESEPVAEQTASKLGLRPDRLAIEEMAVPMIEPNTEAAPMAESVDAQSLDAEGHTTLPNSDESVTPIQSPSATSETEPPTDGKSVDQSATLPEPSSDGASTTRHHYHMFYPGPDWSRYELAEASESTIR